VLTLRSGAGLPGLSGDVDSTWSILALPLGGVELTTTGLDPSCSRRSAGLTTVQLPAFKGVSWLAAICSSLLADIGPS